MKTKKKISILKIVGYAGAVIFLIAIVIAFYMIYNGMGQLPGFDFGAGQYYYTDIPNWQKYFVPDFYENHVPLWILIAIFFIWGFLMYRLWVFVEEYL